MEVLYSHCAGLDVHKKSVVACRCRTEGKQVERELKRFGTTLPELMELVKWLQEWGCSHVGMESTGDYWKPIYNVLEGLFEVILTNAHQVKYVPGRKTDMRDAEWLTELLRHGLLKGSFIPCQEHRALRELTRYRVKLVQERSRQVNRVEKVLEGANIKLSSVASDILGVSGRLILEALIKGETDGSQLAELAKGRLRKKQKALEQALTGRVLEHHRLILAELLEHIDYLDEKITGLEQQINTQLEQLSGEYVVDEKQREKLIEEAENYSTTSPLPFVLAVALLTTIPGVDWRIGVVIVAELGTDMSQFPSSKHVAAWSGVAPGNNESAGKRYSGRTKRGNQALKRMLSQAAWAASRTKETYLSAQYRRLARKRGKKRAIIAVAHSIVVSSYHMLARHERYHDLGYDYFDERKKATLVNNLTRRLNKLGYQVHLEPVSNIG